MRLQEANGYPLNFTLLDAARLTGTRITSLRNYVARGVLKHVGQIPLAGQERRFSVTGLVEVAIIDALSESISLTNASRVADHVFRTAYARAILSGSMQREEWMGSAFPADAEAITSEQNFSDTFLFDANPHHWMKGPQWEHRNLSDPVLCVFALTDNNGLALNVAFGWKDVRRAYRNVAEQTHTVLLPCVPWGGPATDASSLPKPSEEYLNTAVPHVQLLNLTAILAKIDRAIEEKLSAAQV